MEAFPTPVAPGVIDLATARIPFLKPETDQIAAITPQTLLADAGLASPWVDWPLTGLDDANGRKGSMTYDTDEDLIYVKVSISPHLWKPITGGGTAPTASRLIAWPLDGLDDPRGEPGFASYNATPQFAFLNVGAANWVYWQTTNYDDLAGDPSAPATTDVFVTWPLTSLADARGGLAAHAYNPATGFAYLKIAAEPSAWVYWQTSNDEHLAGGSSSPSDALFVTWPLVSLNDQRGRVGAQAYDASTGFAYLKISLHQWVYWQTNNV